MKFLTRFSLARPGATLAVIAAISAVAAAGSLRLEPRTGYRATLGAAHVEVARLDRFIEDFGGGLPIVIAWGCRTNDCESALDPDSVRMAADLEEAFSAIEGVRRVRGPARTPLVFASGEAKFLLADGDPATDLAELVDFAATDPLWVGTLVSADSRAAAIVVELRSSDSASHAHAVDAIRSTLVPYEDRGHRFALVGDPIDFVVGGGALSEEPKKLSAFTVLLIFLTLWILFRSPKVPLSALATVGLAALWTLGLMGWAGWPQTEISQSLVPLILVVGVCDSMHFLSRYGDLRDATKTSTDRNAALLETAADVGAPCLLTSLTTAAGFASFVVSDLASFMRFGLAASVGIVSALLLTFTLLPLLVSFARIDFRLTETSQVWQRAMLLISRASERRPRAILAVSFALMGVSTYGIGQLEIDVSKESLMGSGSPIVRWQRWVESHLRKPDTLEVRLTLPDDAVVSDPAAFAVVGDVAEFLESQENLGKTWSILEPLGRVNQVFHDGDPEFARAGSTGAENEQLLFALGSLDRPSVDHWVSRDRRHLRLSAEAELLTKTERMAVVQSVDEHLRATLPPGWHHELTGPLRVFGAMVEGLHSTQTRSFAGAVVLISLLVGLGLRSAAAALWVMIPTVLPIGVTLGAMGLVGVALDTGTSMIAAIVLGIAVDDSVHLVSHYQRTRRSGAPQADAMRSALSTVGRPVVASSLALSLGFLSLLLSSWGAIASFGFLSALAILAALGADLLLLPALLYSVTGSRSPPSDAGEELRQREVPRNTRTTVALVALTAVAGYLLAVGLQVHRQADSPTPVCALLPNGVMPLSESIRPDCPIGPYEVIQMGGQPPRIDSASISQWLASDSPQSGLVRTTRSGADAEVSIPLRIRSAESQLGEFYAVAAVTMLISLFAAVILVASRAQAAVPLLISAVALCTLLVAQASGNGSAVAQLGGIIGAAILPFSATHLALTFPSTSPLIRLAPGIVRAIYAAAVVYITVLAASFPGRPELNAMALQIGHALAFAAGLAVITSCVVAAASSRSQLERSRARVLLAGASVAAGLAAMLGWLASRNPAHVPGGMAGGFALGALALVFPVAYSIYRYQLFDIRRDFVSAIRFITLLGVFSSALTLFAWALSQAIQDDGPRWFVASALAWGTAEIARHTVWGVVERRLEARAGYTQFLRDLHARRLRALPDREEMSRHTLDILARGTRASFVTIYLKSPRGWHAASAVGGGCTDERLARRASGVAAPRQVVYLAHEEATQSDDHYQLRDKGVEVVAPLDGPEGRLGLVLLGGADQAHSRDGLRFIETVCAQLTLALAWSNTAENLASLEGLAMRGYLTASLAHDLGQPMSAAWAAARSLARRSDLTADARSLAGKLMERAGSALETLTEIMTPPPSANSRPSLNPVGEVISRAACEAEHRTQRTIGFRIGSALPSVSFGTELRQALRCLLDNAIRATRKAGEIDIHAVLKGDVLLIEVVDTGEGMQDESRNRAFEPWYTTHAASGGKGLGLALSRTLMRQAGGDIELVESAVGKGTRMRILLSDFEIDHIENGGNHA